VIDLKKTAKARAKWDRNARFYDFMSRFMEGKKASTWLARLWGSVKGQEILEVGAGTGRSFSYYPGGLAITAIDFSRGMLSRARQKAHRLGLSVNLRQMDVQKLEFADDSFDTVVASCVFCSVPDAVLGLREIRRVIRPGGRLVLLEHVRHDNKLIGKIMDLLNPLFVRLSGPSINRRTLDNLRTAGMDVDTVEDMAMGGILKFIIASPAKNGQQESQGYLTPEAMS
jgi:ubiquinone/menaquinone biosynthesis C-methylase UbiE